MSIDALSFTAWNITALIAQGRAIRILFSYMLMNKTSRTKGDSLSSIYYKSERFTLTKVGSKSRATLITRKSANS